MKQVTDWKHLKKADPVPLVKAIGLVKERFDSGASGMKEPGAEHWVGDTRVHRPILINHIWVEWKRLTGYTCPLPWHDDFVGDLWVRYRKNKDPIKKKLKELLGIPETNQPQENLLC